MAIWCRIMLSLKVSNDKKIVSENSTILVVSLGCGRVNHGEDNGYLWSYGGNGNIEQWATARDALTTRRYVNLFSNFAKEL